MNKSVFPIEEAFGVNDEEKQKLREVGSLMIEREEEPWHVVHVTLLALTLFDQLEAMHGLGSRERFILVCAALLHDTGWSLAPNGRKHHKFSRTVILQHPWQSIQRNDVTLISLVARYHRKSLPKRKHDGFVELTSQEREIVCHLAAILRIADALDRGHIQKVEKIKVTFSAGEIHLIISANADWEAEQMTVNKKGDLLEQIYGRKLVCLASESHS
ncbi:MAG: HD domain-containing protein [Verrucomicrobiota bacterium]|nr:HD domain-containing protein [Verrucomicrobiota bacterium]